MAKDDIEKNNNSSITINSYKEDLYRMKINVHNTNIDKKPFKDLKSYIKAKRGIMERVQVITYKNKRLDLCIDSMRDFEKSKKLSNIIVGLLGLELKEKEVVQTKNLYDLKTRSYMIKNRDMDVCIYDKKAIELRLKNSLDYFEELEDLYIELICKKLTKAIKENKYSNFKAFVNYNGDLFLTKRVFDGVYKVIGLKQTSNSWLKDYRKKSSLEFESKDSLTKQHKLIGKAIICFRGNLKDWEKINQARKK